MEPSLPQICGHGEVWTPERQEKARKAVHSWAGTPHKNRLRVKGLGVDCVNFMHAVLIEAEVVEFSRLPFYDERLGALRKTNLIEGIILAHVTATVHPPEDPQFGDLVICKCGRQTNHVGVIIDGEVWHCPFGSGVGPESWDDRWRSRTQSLVRITKPGYTKSPGSLTWPDIQKIIDA